MSIIASISSVIVISSILYVTYPQQLYINLNLQKESKLEFKEKSVVKNFDYLKEDIKIPQLVDGKNENKIKLINTKISNDILPKVEEAEKISKEYFDGVEKQIPTFPYEVYSRYTISEDNDLIISLYNDYYEYLGGAHGVTTRTSYTIDKKKEELITLKNLFIEGYNYIDIINKEIKTQISANPENYFDSGSSFKGIDENQNFYISDDNLIIYYQLYDIAPYVFGIPEFKIPLKLFDKNYIYYKD